MEVEEEKDVEEVTGAVVRGMGMEAMEMTETIVVQVGSGE